VNISSKRWIVWGNLKVAAVMAGRMVAVDKQQRIRGKFSCGRFLKPFRTCSQLRPLSWPLRYGNYTSVLNNLKLSESLVSVGA
jgi:hypothetical protein